jgi:hypothetical protein
VLGVGPPYTVSFVLRGLLGDAYCTVSGLHDSDIALAEPTTRSPSKPVRAPRWWTR